MIPLEEEMATNSIILTWRIPWTEEPAGYSPWGHKKLDTTKHIHTIKDQGRQAISGYGIKHHKPSYEWWNEYSMLRGQLKNWIAGWQQEKMQNKMVR